MRRRNPTVPPPSRRSTTRVAAGRPRLSMDERRAQLIRTTSSVFAEYGFKGTTTRQLAQAAGVTEAVIFQHFVDKDALYAAVLERKAADSGTDAWLDDLERLAAADDAAGLLTSLYEHIVDVHERDASFARLMVYSALEHHALARRMQDAHSQRLYRVLEGFIVRGQAAGRFRAAAPPVLVRVLLSLPTYHVLQRRLFRPAWPAADPTDVISTGVSFALAGLMATGETQSRRRTPHRASA